MPDHPSDPPRQPRGLWGRLLAALSLRSPQQDILPVLDQETGSDSPGAGPEEAQPAQAMLGDPPLAEPVLEAPAAEASSWSAFPPPGSGSSSSPREAAPAQTWPGPPAELSAAESLPPQAKLAPWDRPPPEPESPAGTSQAGGAQAPQAEPEKQPPLPPCPVCGAERVPSARHCLDCGWVFTEQSAAGTPSLREAAGQGRVIAGRYRLRQQLSQRDNIVRWLAEDLLADPVHQVLVVEDRVVGQASRTEPEHILTEAWSEPADGEATGIDLDAPGSPSAWPSLAWEERLLRKLAQHPGLPRLRERVTHDGQTFLVEEVPPGRLLWDAWDEARDDPEQRYGWLIQVAETLVALHQAGAIVDGLRPDIVLIADDGRALLADLSDLLPLPLPAQARVQATPYTPPELIFAPEAVDARCDLYSFGALLYALFLGRELTEMEFERQGVPKPFVMHFPDAHPALARVLMKTLVREVHLRFPTEDAGRQDPSGFAELIENLRALGRSEAQGRLDVAGWTTTGMLRSNNEDAFAIYHLSHSRQEAIGEKLLIFLADGMGGYEAGEVAAAMTLDILRQRLLGELGQEGLSDAATPGSPQPDPAALHHRFLDALRQANQEIYTLSRTPGSGKRGMGCTAEVLHLDGRCVVGAHVGDSRVYHFSQGKLRLLTRDQTLVNRLVELGQLTPEEAEQHPRKNELQQAVGGQPFLDPQTYTAVLRPGDWLVVCSDGLTSHVSDDLLVELLQRADSAEMCCRRLVNLANLQGGSDNCTVVVVRVT